jgi:putative ABC transport system permease protein
MDGLIQDLRFALRQIALRPLQSGIAIVTLALGIVATTATFSLLQPILINPLPHPESERLLVLSPFPWMHSDAVAELTGQGRSLDAMAGYYPRSLAVTGGDQPLQVEAAAVSPDFFHLTGVTIAAGRAFAADEANAVAIIDASLNAHLFGTDSALGRDLLIDGEPHQIIGVLQPDVARPLPQLDRPQLWLPLTVIDRRADRASWVIPLARLRDGATQTAAQAELDAALHHYRDGGIQLPADHYRWQPLREALVGDQRRPLLLLQLAVGLVLLLACVNVANLQLARITARAGEITLRLSLGARRQHVYRQVLVESLLLAVLAGALALLLLAIGAGALNALLPADLLRLGSPAPDALTVLFALSVAVFAGLASGLLPAMLANRMAPAKVLREQARGLAGSPRSQRIGAMLVVAQVALTLVLLAGAGLLIGSYRMLAGEPPGFRSDQVLVLPLRFAEPQHSDLQSLEQDWQRLLQRVQAVPGVAAASFANRVPLSRGVTIREFFVDGEHKPRYAQHGVVSAGYLDTLDIPLLRGRFFSDADRRGSERVTVIDAALWRQLWPEQDPIGQRLRLSAGGDAHWLSVIGVVGDIRGSGLASPPRPGFYVPYQQRPLTDTEFTLAREGVLLVRADGDIDALPAALRAAIHQAAPQLPVTLITALDTLLADSIGPQRFRAIATGSFGVLALALAIAGVYAVTAHRVAGRVHEFGVRRALGARRTDLVRHVLGWALRLAAIGAAVGLLGALALGRVLDSLLHGVSATDPRVLLGAAIVLTLAVLAAAWGPASRAARTDPMEALRGE